MIVRNKLKHPAHKRSQRQRGKEGGKKYFGNFLNCYIVAIAIYHLTSAIIYLRPDQLIYPVIQAVIYLPWSINNKITMKRKYLSQLHAKLLQPSYYV